MNYFHELVKKLGKNDLLVINTLYTNEAINKLSALDRTKIILDTGIRDYSLRKTLERLESMQFIEVSKSNRHYEFYLTEHGINAVNKLTEGIEC
jgi:predicted transcriptional regulator